MSATQGKITCPNCDHRFDVEEILVAQAEERIRSEYDAMRKTNEAKLREEKKALQEQQEAFEEKKAKENELFASRMEAEKKKLEVELEARLQKQTAEQFEAKLEALEKDNQRKALENKELREKEVQMLQMKKDLQLKEEEYDLRLQKQLFEKEESVRKEVSSKLQEKHEMEKQRYEKQLADQKKLSEEQMRKMQQGSMQTQGEVLELLIEQSLRESFPLDTVEEVKKGAFGADVIFTVKDDFRNSVGKIAIESKDTKRFETSWIPKLKGDMQKAEAQIGIIVSTQLPDQITDFGEVNGVWVCHRNSLVPLIKVLKQMVLKVSSALTSQENKSDKVHLLYDFLLSDTFKQQVGGIIDAYIRLKDDIDSEKRAFNKRWKQREKLLDAVIDNTTNMYGSITAIGGKGLIENKFLELDDGLEIEDED